MSVKSRLMILQHTLDSQQINVSLVLTPIGVEIKAKNYVDRLLAAKECERNGFTISPLPPREQAVR